MVDARTIRLDCRWYLRYGGIGDFCRKDVFTSPTAPFRKLDFGCDCDPLKDYQPMRWKAEMYGTKKEPE